MAQDADACGTVGQESGARAEHRLHGLLAWSAGLPRAGVRLVVDAHAVIVALVDEVRAMLAFLWKKLSS